MHQDLLYAFRTLPKRPGFTMLILLTLAVGIGANTAIFSVVKGVLLNPLPFEEPERLVGVWHTSPGLGFKDLNCAPATYYTYREEGRAFEDTGLWRGEGATVTELGEPERVDVLRLTPNTLPLLRVRAQIGRTFTKEDENPATPPTVVLTYWYWQRKFGGKEDVLQRTMMIDGKQHAVVGVLPRDFRFLNEHPAIVLPLRFKRAEIFVGQFSYLGVARLKPGVTLKQANEDIARMLPMLQQKFPLPPGLTLEMLASAKIAPALRPFKEDAVGDVGMVLWILMGTAGVVLLIACANVANLLLVRGEGRQQELAIRNALGADWMTIARQLLAESLLLGIAGGAAGLLIAAGAIRALVTLRPSSIPRLDEITIEPAVLLYALGISLFSGLLFGLFPVLKFAGPKLAFALRDGGRAASASRERHRVRNVLVVVQVAMALVLLIGSGLMLRTFQSLRQVHPGFTRPREVLTMGISIPHAQVPDPQQAVRMHERIVRSIERIPGVQSVAMASSVTMDSNYSNDPVFIEDFPEEGGKLPPLRRYKFVSEGYFRAMGNPIVAGRELTWADAFNLRNTVVISENFARKYWKTPAAALGKRVRETPKSPWREIVGVAGDERDDGAEKAAPITIFWPVLIKSFWGEEYNAQYSGNYIIRSSRTGTDSLLKDVQSAIWSVNPGLPTANVRTLAEIQNRSMMRTSFTLLMLAVAGAVAMLLGVIGIYGVISYSVSQRTREIGIRMALGAQRGEVSSLFLAYGLRLTAIGLVIGLAAAYGATRLLSSLLFGVSPVDPLTYSLVAALLALAALLACYIPARSASSMDPVQALHSE